MMLQLVYFMELFLGSNLFICLQNLVVVVAGRKVLHKTIFIVISHMANG